MRIEVNRWRGSPEQRASRAGVRKLGQFSYFDSQLGHPDWTGKTVLDFGGGDGNLLWNPDCAIRPEDYYCIDVVPEAIEDGRRNFPTAHWLHYDRYNCSFNPGGQSDPIPDLGFDFDVILAYSVFTHTTREDMDDLVRQLLAFLAPGGALAYTFEDPHFEPWPGSSAGSNLQRWLERCREENPAVDVDGMMGAARGSKWCALVDGSQLFVESSGVYDQTQSCSAYDVFYTARFMAELYPNATIHPPALREKQHCCIIRRRA
jgi:SAM-dependent methyltransferase